MNPIVRSGLMGAAALTLVNAAAGLAAPPSTRPAAHPAAAAARPTTISGPVKEAPQGTTFVVNRKSGPVTVDAHAAKVTMNGKPAQLDDLKAGSTVTVRGTMQGKTVMAQEVRIQPAHGGTTAAHEPGGARPNH